MDGLELLQRLASGGHRIPILTAHGDDEVRSRALGAGAAAFLAKPFNGEVLLAAVKAALGGNGSETPVRATQEGGKSWTCNIALPRTGTGQIAR
jgi:two-component system response regulator FixJ